MRTYAYPLSWAALAITVILGGCSNTPVPGVTSDAAVKDSATDAAVNDATPDAAINDNATPPDGITWPDRATRPDSIGPVADIGPGLDGISPVPDVGPRPDGISPLHDIGSLHDIGLPTDLGFRKCGPWLGGNCPKSYVCNIQSCAPGAGGSCVWKPSACPKIYKPVCGCDNKTYDNDCLRLRAEVALQYTGTCKISPFPDGGSPDGPVQFKCGGPTHTQCTLSNQFCDKEYCSPNAFGSCTSIPTACAYYYAPVCGCDNKTYDNDCFRKHAKVSLQYKGKCKILPGPDAGVADAGSSQKCGGPANITCMAFSQFCDRVDCSKTAYGTCTSVPTACPKYYKPVCGCDNKTYDNDCFRKHAKVSLQYKGKCKILPGPDAGVADAGSSQKCGGPANITCMALSQFCDKENCSKSAYGTCKSIPTACTYYYAPVCGCDKKTYLNDCFRQQAQVPFAYKGTC